MQTSEPKRTRPDHHHGRRKFLWGAAALAGGGAAAAALHFKPWYRPLGANADVRIGLAGCGSKGRDHARAIATIPGARLVALCDPDPNQIEAALADPDAGLHREAVARFADFREFVASPEIDAVIVASPNHWHALMGVWALQAGKHVYIEKPVAHSIWEGEQLVRAARDTGLVVQSGTQRRSDDAYREAAAWLAQGHLGAPTSARAVVYRHRSRLTKRKNPTPLPDGVDYDHWCGPAPAETLFRAKLHYDWHWVWETGDGELGNNGIHFLDVARLILGLDALPPATLSIGGRFGWGDDAGQTPNTHLTIFDYPTPVLAEMRNLPIASGRDAMDAHHGVREGLVVECEGGTLAWPVARDNAGNKVQKFSSHGGHGHRVNWLKAVADNRPEDVNAPIGEGHLSSALCHLGNASHRAGSHASTDAIVAALDAHPAARPAIDSLNAHLARNGVDLDSHPWTLGPTVTPADASGAPPMRAPYQLPASRGPAARQRANPAQGQDPEPV